MTSEDGKEFREITSLISLWASLSPRQQRCELVANTCPKITEVDLLRSVGLAPSAASARTKMFQPHCALFCETRILDINGDFVLRGLWSSMPRDSNLLWARLNAEISSHTHKLQGRYTTQGFQQPFKCMFGMSKLHPSTHDSNQF